MNFYFQLVESRKEQSIPADYSSKHSRPNEEKLDLKQSNAPKSIWSTKEPWLEDVNMNAADLIKYSRQNELPSVTKHTSTKHSKNNEASKPLSLSVNDILSKPEKHPEHQRNQQETLKNHGDTSKYYNEGSKHQTETLKHHSDASKHHSEPSKHRTDVSKHHTESSKHHNEAAKQLPEVSKHHADTSTHQSETSKHRIESSKHYPDGPRHQSDALKKYADSSKIHNADISRHQSDSLKKYADSSKIHNAMFKPYSDISKHVDSSKHHIDSLKYHSESSKHRNDGSKQYSESSKHYSESSKHHSDGSKHGKPGDNLKLPSDNNVIVLNAHLSKDSDLKVGHKEYRDDVKLISKTGVPKSVHNQIIDYPDGRSKSKINDHKSHNKHHSSKDPSRSEVKSSKASDLLLTANSANYFTDPMSLSHRYSDFGSGSSFLSSTPNKIQRSEGDNDIQMVSFFINMSFC